MVNEHLLANDVRPDPALSGVTANYKSASTMEKPMRSFRWLFTYSRGLVISIAAILASCGGGNGSSTVTTPVPQPPTVQFSVMQSVIDASTTTNITWSSQDASTCEASGDWSGSKGPIGSEVVGPLYGDTSLTLTCTGSGGSTSRELVIDVEPILVVEKLASVISLDDAATSLLVSQSESQLTFNALMPLVVGSVFTLSDVAYKVTAIQLTDGQMIVSVAMPELNEVFERLRIAGRFSGDPEVALSIDPANPLELMKGKTSILGQQASGSASIPFSVGNGFLSAGGDFSVSFVATADVDYTIEEGLKKADFLADITNSISNGTIGVSVGSGSFPPKRIAILRYPIGLTGVVIQMPFSVVAGASSDIEMSSRISSSMRAVGSIKYGKESGLSGDITFPSTDAQFSVSSLGAASSAIEPSLTLDLLLQVRPMLQILGYPLVGVEIGVGPFVKFSGRLNGSMLCGQITGAAVAKGKGLVKGFGYDLSTNEVSTTFGSFLDVTAGKCPVPTMVTINVPQGVQVYKGTAVDIKVSVAKADSGSSSAAIPTGIVTVKLDGQECVAQLFNGAGSCSIEPTLALTREITAAYAGDANFAAATGTAALDVGLRSATARFTTSGSVTFTLPIPPPLDFICTSPLNATNELTFNLEGSPSATNNYVGSGASNCRVPVQGQFTVQLTKSGTRYTGILNTDSDRISVEAEMTETGVSGSMSMTGNSPVTSTDPSYPPGSAAFELSGDFFAIGQ